MWLGLAGTGAQGQKPRSDSGGLFIGHVERQYLCTTPRDQFWQNVPLWAFWQMPRARQSHEEPRAEITPGTGGDRAFFWFLWALTETLSPHFFFLLKKEVSSPLRSYTVREEGKQTFHQDEMFSKLLNHPQCIVVLVTLLLFSFIQKTPFYNVMPLGYDLDPQQRGGYVFCLRKGRRTDNPILLPKQ